jgi:HSP20 family protein
MTREEPALGVRGIRGPSRAGAWYDPAMSWDPVRDVRAWQERLERLAVHHADSWAPPIDVYETSECYVVTAELPGLTREEVDLALEDTRLTIRARRTNRGQERRDVLHFHQVERGHGAFARSFDFADKIDVAGVEAQLADGVLTIKIPKLAPPPARRIEVR